MTAVVSDDLPGAVARCQASDFFVVMTRGHASDLPILTELYRLHPAPRYVGCMGSAVKAARLRRELALADVSVAALANFYCPIGLPVGGNVPAEIAISVVAQLLQVRDSGTSQPGADAAASAP
ncbi:MAG: XdhC family protein [Myxococcales bacterium]|nr:XdhC family protein [Myxococcales bacterium]